MTRIFNYDGHSFRIVESIDNDRYTVKVFLGEQQISPEYSATFEVGRDYFAQHKTRIIDELSKIAESDIRNGIYFQA